MLLHTGSPVDFGRHCAADGETAADVFLDRTCGPAIVINLTFLGEDEPITVELLSSTLRRCARATSPCAGPAGPRRRGAGSRLLHALAVLRAGGGGVARGPRREGRRLRLLQRAVRSAARFTSEDFVVHKAILDRGAILIQQLHRALAAAGRRPRPVLRRLRPDPRGERYPGRMFALIEEEER